MLDECCSIGANYCAINWAANTNALLNRAAYDPEICTIVQNTYSQIGLIMEDGLDDLFKVCELNATL